MKKILIVEDMILLRDTMANTINAQEDMRVVGVAASADEALDLCRKLSLDLALIDVVTEGKIKCPYKAIDDSELLRLYVGKTKTARQLEISLASL